MRVFWRPLALAAAFVVIAATGPASAQTVIVTQAPAASAIQLGLNSDTVATATADAKGQATLSLDLASHGGKKDTDARIFVDVCGTSRRITLVETGYEPPMPAAGCVRHQIFGVFYIRDVTTLVVNASEESQAVWLRQGPVPGHWLSNEVAGGSAEATGSALLIPDGFVAFAGGGIGRYSNAVAVSCGTQTDCVGKGTRLTGRFGVDIWLKPHLAVSASYLRPVSAQTAGSGSGYTFTSSLGTNLAVVTAKLGFSARRFRFYGEGGADYTWAKLTSVETIADRTVTVDGSPVTIPGGTQTLTLKTGGIGWVFGGGVEYWMKRKVGLYTEIGRAKLRGTPVSGGEGRLDDGLFYALVGFKLHVLGG